MALDFNTEPYFDDYKANKDFYRILFRPSYAVQARELTQLQTILQNQVSRFGDHIFKNGSQVVPGSVQVDNKVHFVKLEKFTGTQDVTVFLNDFKNMIVEGATSKVKMVVVDTSQGGNVVDNLTEPTLYCKVIGTSTDNETNRLQPGENLVASLANNTTVTNYRLTEDLRRELTVIVKTTGSGSEEATTYKTKDEVTNPDSSNVLGYGMSVSVAAGIYYIDGIFARNDDLKLYVGRFNNTPSCRVGFKVTENYVTPEDDESILDNATGSYNFAAPGAHRYKISLSLVKLPLDSTDNIRFIELVRIVNGEVQFKVQSSSYAELEKTLARRTFDESGNYEVNKFKMSTREHLNDGTNKGVYPAETVPKIAGKTYGDIDKFVTVIDPGKAYISGYEVESISPQYVEMEKAREIDNKENGHVYRIAQQTVAVNFGNWVKVEDLYKVPDIKSFSSVYLIGSRQPRQAVLSVNSATGASSGLQTSDITIIDGGEGYSTGSHPVVIQTNGTGSGAVVTATASGGKITSVTVTTAGSSYPTINTSKFIKAYCTDGLTLGAVTTDIVGTARVKALKLHSGDYTFSSTYKLGLFDITMKPGYSFDAHVKSIVSTISGTFGCNISPTLVPVEVGTVATSSTANANINSTGGTTYTTSIAVGDVVYLNETRVGTVLSRTNSQIVLSANALVSITDGRLSVARATIFNSEASLIFPVGRSFTKTLRGRDATNTEDIKDESQLKIRRVVATDKSPSSGSFTFNLSSNTESFSSSTDLSNFLLIEQTSGRPLNLTAENFQSISSSDVTFTLIPNGTYTLIATVTQTLGQAAARKKKLTQDYSYKVTNKNILAGSFDLEHCDILRLKSVKMTPGSYTAYDPENAVDISDRYTLDNGQRDTYYGKGRLNLKPGYQAPNGAVEVVYDYFYVSETAGNYFSVDSYMNIKDFPYEDIPTYVATDPSSGKKTEICLSDVIDFRPYLSGLNASYSSGFKPEMIDFGADFTSPVAFYVGRIDKISLDSIGKLHVLRGVPGINPQEPDDPKDGMVLGSVSIPPYTKDVKTIIVNQRDNKRYTMGDIGKLERRISNLEYYVTLSLLEKETADMAVVDEDGNDRFKNGFIVDQFTGHNIGDVKNIDYKIAIDPQTRILRPMHYTQDVEFVEHINSGAERSAKTYRKTGDLITLPYTETSYIFNRNATRSLDVQVLAAGSFKGQVELFPASDSWKSVEQRPDLTVVDDNNYDAIKYIAEQTGVVGTKWNEWETNWTAQVPRYKEWETKVYTGYAVQYIHTGYETTFQDYIGYDFREGIQTDVTSMSNAQDAGNRVIDASYIPFMRSRPITVIAQNLKASTKFYPFFDNVDVRDYFQPADVFNVTRDGQTLMSFRHEDINNNILADSDRRAYNGNIESAFSIGDVIRNLRHEAVTISSIKTFTTDTAASFEVVVSNTTNILPGHHVVLYNLFYHDAIEEQTLLDLKENQKTQTGTPVIPASVGIDNPAETSAELNLKKFRVKTVSAGNTLVLENLDGSPVSKFSAYSTASYRDNKRGMLYRLMASGVVAFGGVISESDSIGTVTQEIHVVNVKNGFGVGESLVGEVIIDGTTYYNNIRVNSINGNTTTSAASTMKQIGDQIIADTEGNVVGVFYLPESKELSFRTGERTFKLTDNQSNSDYALDSSGSCVYYAQGLNLVKERTIISSRSSEFVQSPAYEDDRGINPPQRRTTTSVRQIYRWVEDPLAQTFTVGSTGGCFLTSIDLFLSSKNDKPLSIEIRNTDNGVPSTKIVPLSQVTKANSELLVSDDSSVPTNFKFKSPIYLQEAETYALVVATSAPGTQVYVSEMGENDILTKNVIVGQPLIGSLYASQNSTEWEIHPLLDMKVNINKAVFDTSTGAEVEFRANPPKMVKADKNPFEITPNTNKIRVWVRNHGLQGGQLVTISNVAPGYYGTEYVDMVTAAGTQVGAGIPHTLLNATHTVLSEGITKDSFIIDLNTTINGKNLLTYKQYDAVTDKYNVIEGSNANFVKGEYGGEGVMCSGGLNLDYLFFKNSDLVFKNTKLDYYVNSTDVDGNTTGYQQFIANKLHSFSTRQNICSYENQSVDINGNKKPSLTIKGVMNTTNENISPVIDIQQISGYVTSNCVNNPATATHNVAEIDTRVLISNTTTLTADYTFTGAGTITAATNSATVTGVGATLFLSNVAAGDIIKSGANLIGTVLSVGTDNSLTLTANAATAVTSAAYTVNVTPSLYFVNENGVGVIRTNIDKADNMLESAGIGKTITIAGVAASVNGTYVITDIQTTSDTGTTYKGNEERDTVTIKLNQSFASLVGTLDIDMSAQNSSFSISVLDGYVSDLAPVGCSNDANYVTRTLSLTEAAENIKVVFDSNIINSTNIKVYYRTWTGNVDLNKLPYIDTGFSASNNDVEGKFVERTVEVNGLKPFYNVQIKLVLTSSLPTKVPMVKNLRLLALS